MAEDELARISPDKDNRPVAIPGMPISKKRQTPSKNRKKAGGSGSNKNRLYRIKRKILAKDRKRKKALGR